MKKFKEWLRKPKEIVVHSDNGLNLFNIDVPDELFVEIFSFLEGKEIAQKVECTCKNWKRIGNSEYLWRIVLDAYIQQGKKAKVTTFSNVFAKAFPGNNVKAEYIKEYIHRNKKEHRRKYFADIKPQTL